MKTIKIPSYIDIEKIENEILEIYPLINKKQKNLSKQFTERILLFFDEIRKSVKYNEQLYIKNRLPLGSVPYAQICKNKRIKLFPKPCDSDYSERIFEEVLLKYLYIKEYDHKIRGWVRFYLKGKCCHQFKFIIPPTSYVPYKLETKVINSKVEVLKEMELNNDELTPYQNSIRKRVIGYTEQFTLLNNHSSRAILVKRLKRVNTTPTEFIESFNINDSRTISDKFGYRLHHSISNLKSGLHQHLRLNNKKVVSLDITASQPYISSILTSSMLDTMIKFSASFSYLEPIKPILDKYQSNTDYLEYQKLCVSGSIYEYLMKSYYKMFNEKITRKEVKTTLFIGFFSDYDRHERYRKKEYKRGAKLLKKTFPSLYEMFKEIQKVDLNLKVLNNTIEGEEVQESYKNIALILQRVETFIFFDVIIPQIIGALPNLIFSSVHDSIVLGDVEEDVHIVKRIMLDSFMSLGVQPPIIVVK